MAACGAIVECNKTAHMAVQEEGIQIHYMWNNLSKNLVRPYAKHFANF